VRTFTKMLLNTYSAPTSCSCYALKSEILQSEESIGGVLSTAPHDQPRQKSCKRRRDPASRDLETLQCRTRVRGCASPCSAASISSTNEIVFLNGTPKIGRVSVPPPRLLFPETTCGHRAGRRGRRLFLEKRGLLNWFITKVAPSGSRFAEAGEASRHSLYTKTQARQESNKHAYMYSIKGHLHRSRRTDFSVIPLLRG
jgi:hypothetical protein